MKASTVIWIIIIIIIVVAGIWYWSSTGSGNANNASSTTNYGQSNQTSSTTSANTTVVLDTANTSTLGTYLIAANGMTLYQYARDKAGVSNCTGACATLWPPYTVPAGATSSMLGGGSGATGQIGVITRADGTSQLTYNNIPLYFYSKDQAIGDTNGQGVGRLWTVVSPSAGASSPSAATTSSGGINVTTTLPTVPAY